MDGVVMAVRRFAQVRRVRARVQPHCQVCLAPGTSPRVVRDHKSGRKMTVHICPRCGYVEMPENTHDYTTSTSVANLGLAARCGTLGHTGGAYGMAQLGIDVLRRSDLSVLVYGVGRSLDNLHISRLSDVRRVAIGDISRPATERFDIVVASEVIEHFEDPRVEFAKLFGYVEPDGVLICSTNIYDGGRQHYIFGSGHVSHYTAEALRSIATANRMQVNFQVPLSATEAVGGRKRYVIFARLPEVMDSVSDYFGRHTYAPSEAPRLDQRRATRRAVGRGGANPTDAA